MESIWKNKKRSNNKRRFNDEQIRLLESMFQAESRPELQIKQRLANELGLQPRQVAIWFQNKRARSKSKLIQQDYNVLKSNYDALASKFDSLKKENQCLLVQLKALRNLMVEPQSSRNHEVGQAGESIDQGLDNMDTGCSEGEEKTNLVLACDRHETQMPLSDDTRENTEFGEGNQYMKMEELVPDGSLTSSANWWSFESSCALDHPSCNSQCWEL